MENKESLEAIGRKIMIFLLVAIGLVCFIFMMVSPIYSIKSENKGITKIDKRLSVTNQEIILNDSIVLCRFIPVVGGEIDLCHVDSNLRIVKGSDSAQYVSDYDYQHIHIKSFLMAEIPVTNELYRFIMYNHYPIQGLPSRYYVVESPANWDIFLEKLCERTGRLFRLPTGAEWEYAAKGGVKKHDYTYSGSNEIKEVANYEGNTPAVPHVSPKRKKPNNLGLYDMSGSVWELTSDVDEVKWNSCYSKDGSKAYPPRIARGGCYESSADECAITAPGKLCCDDASVGVRLVLEYVVPQVSKGKSR